MVPFDDLGAGRGTVLVHAQPAHLTHLAEDIMPMPLRVLPRRPPIPRVHDNRSYDRTSTQHPDNPAGAVIYFDRLRKIIEGKASLGSGLRAPTT
jgi:hypothetical protein